MIKRYRVTVNDEIYQISVESIKGEESAPRALAPAPGPRPARPVSYTHLTSMQSTCMTLVGYELAKYLNTGEITKPNGNAAYEVGFSDTVPVKDGQVMVDASEDDAFAAFMKLLGLEEHLEDERFKDAVSRHDHADSLKELILPAAGAYTMSELAQLCRAAGVPAGEVNTQDRLLLSLIHIY